MTPTQRADNERCAAWFESKPTYEPESHGDLSPRGAWVASYFPGNSPGMHFLDWHPFDPLNDESANAMLLDAMKSSLLYSAWPGCEGWRVDLGVQYLNGPPIGPTHPDRKTAVVMAFLAYMSANPKESSDADKH